VLTEYVQRIVQEAIVKRIVDTSEPPDWTTMLMPEIG